MEWLFKYFMEYDNATSIEAVRHDVNLLFEFIKAMTPLATVIVVGLIASLIDVELRLRRLQKKIKELKQQIAPPRA